MVHFRSWHKSRGRSTSYLGPETLIGYKHTERQMGRLRYWNRIRGTVGVYRSQVRFAMRMTGAGLLALIVAQSLALPLHGLWVVLTAVVVTQMSVGGALRATIEYNIGTLRGAGY